MVKGGQISVGRVTDTLRSSQEGAALLEKVTVKQVINRIKYERQQYLQIK